MIQINDQIMIPLIEIEFRFSTSGGPGGQHANKSETQVTLIFDVQQSPSLDEPARERLLQKLATRLDKSGVLQISVQESRSQHQNREIAMARFQTLLSDALRPTRPRRPTRPSRAAHERRLTTKRQRSRLKQDRRKRFDG